MSRVVRSTIAALGVLLAVSAMAVAANPGADVRLTSDDPATRGGYTSDYTLVTGQPYSDATLDECTLSRAGAQNEPAVASTRGTRK